MIVLTETKDNYVSNGPGPYFLKACKYIDFTGGRALDLGCGTGGNLAYLKNNFNMQVEGCDRNPDNYKYHKKLDNLNIINCDIREYPFKGKYDVIICFNVLMYISKEEQLELLKKIKNHITKNGIIILSIMTHGWNSGPRNVINNSDIFKILGSPIDSIKYSNNKTIDNKTFEMFVFKN